jgi:PKD repeat protein
MQRGSRAPVVAALAIALVACGGELLHGPDCATDADLPDAGGDADADADADEEPPNTPPEAAFESAPGAGVAPLDVTFDGLASFDADGDALAFDWDFGDGSGPGAGAVVTHRFEAAGCFAVSLTVTDGRGGADAAESIVVTTAAPPEGEPAFTLEGLPAAMAVLQRDLATNAGAFTVSGTVASPGYTAVRVVVSRDGAETEAFEAPLCSTSAPDPFAVTAQIEAALASHTVEVRLVAPASETPIATTTDVVAGDVLLVQGQSNAVATMSSGDANVDQGPFVRSFGTRIEDAAATAADLSWRLAEGNATEGPGAVGQWSLRMARLLSDAHGVPVAVINGARGGRPIAYFQRNDADPTDLTTNYGRLLFRARAAGVADDARAILYYQGESDGADAAGHRAGLEALVEDWRADFASIERVYVTQVRPGCGEPSIELRDAQRRIADELDGVSVMSTTGLDGHDGCHFTYENGYERLGARYAALLGRDLFGDAPAPDVDAPNVEGAAWSDAAGTEIRVAARDRASTLTWDPGAELDFALEGAPVSVIAGRAEGADLVLTLSGDGRAATGLAYLGHQGAGPWVRNATGVGLLQFRGVPIDP